jgi:hypothetical protein
MSITILDPTDERTPVRRETTARTGSISGVVGMLDISKPRGSVLLDELETLLAKELPDVKLKRYSKPTFAKPCPDELRRKIKGECAYVIEALAD